MTISITKVYTEAGRLMFKVKSDFPVLAYYIIYEEFVEHIGGQTIRSWVEVRNEEFWFTFPGQELTKGFYPYNYGLKYKIEVGNVGWDGSHNKEDEAIITASEKPEPNARIENLRYPKEVPYDTDAMIDLTIKNYSDTPVFCKLRIYTNNELRTESSTYTVYESQDINISVRVGNQETNIKLELYAKYLDSQEYLTDTKEFTITPIEAPENAGEGSDYIAVHTIDSSGKPMQGVTVELFRCDVPYPISCPYMPYGILGIEPGYRLIATKVTDSNGDAKFIGVNRDYDYAIAVKYEGSVKYQFRITEQSQFNMQYTITVSPGMLDWFNQLGSTEKTLVVAGVAIAGILIISSLRGEKVVVTR